MRLLEALPVEAKIVRSYEILDHYLAFREVIPRATDVVLIVGLDWQFRR